MVRPLGSRLVIHPVQQETVSAGGIFIPSVAQNPESVQQAKVFAVGPQVVEVKEGDLVLFNKFGGSRIKFGGEEYVIVKEEELYGVLES